MNDEFASINLSRETLERLSGDLWTLSEYEHQQIQDALHAMEATENMEEINIVPNPKGTVSAPNRNG